MKYYSRLKLYKQGALVYNPSSEVATSYDWWVLLRRVNGVLVLNTFRYSMSTGRHIRNLKKLLDSKGIKYLEINSEENIHEDSIVYPFVCLTLGLYIVVVCLPSARVAYYYI